VYDTSTPTPTCFPKNTSSIYSSNTFIPSMNTTTYIRDKTVLQLPPGVNSAVNNITSLQYENYPAGTGNMQQSSSGFSNVDQSQKQQLQKLQEKLNQLSLQINKSTSNFSNINYQVNKQMKKDIASFDKYVDETNVVNTKINNIKEGYTILDTNLDNIVNDTKISTLQKNYSYIAWSILAATLVFIAIKIKK
jgi:TolA-binding protein